MLILASRDACAGNPEMAAYTDDPDEVFWFIQITDTHIDNFLYGAEVEQMELALGEVVDVVQPFFLVNTGDLTDHTDGVNYLGPPNVAEWTLYRGITDDAGMDTEFYFDLPGNHDLYGDDGTFYVTYSVQGEATGSTQPHWVLDLPWGSYHFVTGATPHNDSPPLPWPFDNLAFSAAELDEVEANLLAHTDARLTIAFGHHDFERCALGGDFRQHLLDYGAAHYGHGHEHDVGMREGAGILRFRCNTIGQGSGENICLWAVDSDAVSWGVTHASAPWPATVITAPVDARLGSDDAIENPYAPAVPNGCSAAPVRVLAFDGSGVDEVLFQVDGGSLETMTENTARPDQWMGTFDATGLGAGIHTLEVQVSGTEWRRTSAQILVEDAPCPFDAPPVEEDLEPEPVPEEQDEPEVEPPPDAGVDVADDPALDVEDEPGEPEQGGGCGCALVA